MTKFAKQTTVAPAMIAQAYETGRVPSPPPPDSGNLSLAASPEAESRAPVGAVEPYLAAADSETGKRKTQCRKL